MSEKSKMGRPKGRKGIDALTDSTKKKKKGAYNKNYREGKVRMEMWVTNAMKEQIVELKEEKGFGRNSDVLIFLLDMYQEEKSKIDETSSESEEPAELPDKLQHISSLLMSSRHRQSRTEEMSSSKSAGPSVATDVHLHHVPSLRRSPRYHQRMTTIAETSSDSAESFASDHQTSVTPVAQCPRRSPRKRVMKSHSDRGQGKGRFDEISSASEAESVVYPYNPSAPRQFTSTPSAVQPLYINNYFSGTQEKNDISSLRVPSSCGSSDIPNMSSCNEMSDVESLLSDMEQAAIATSKGNDTVMSGIWEVEVHGELLPSDEEEVPLGRKDESYYPSSAASSDSIDESEDIAQQLIANVEFKLLPTEDEDFNINEPEEEEMNVNLDGENDENEEDEEIDQEADGSTGKKPRVKNYIRVDSYDAHREDLTSLAFGTCLQQLASMDPPRMCRKCKGPVQLIEKQVGTAIYLKWICNDHEKLHVEREWCSQPRFKHGALLGDFMASCAVLFSGNDYSKICLFMNCINMKAMSKTTYYKICTKYAFEAVSDTWQQVQDDILKEYMGREIVVLGDGRMDSPGFCAEYCTYTLMECDSKDIVYMGIINKRETGLNSVTMEREGCRQGLDILKEKNMNVVELASDAHIQISCMIKKEYEGILHSLDVWHGAKNLGKRLTKAALVAKSKRKALLPWIKDVVTHFWHCVKTCTEFEEFMEKWRGVAHHVCNKHHWIGHPTDDDLEPWVYCEHGDIEEPTGDKTWLEADSPAHKTLIEVILDPKFLKTIPKYLKFRNTSMLESFHNIILMYVPKRISFRPPAYKARCTLAALDYQNNKDRPLHVTKKGELSIHRKWRKSSKRWDVHLEKEKKSYHHITGIMNRAVESRIAHPERMKQLSQLQPEDPRHIMKHLTVVEPPSSKTLYESKQSRM